MSSKLSFIYLAVLALAISTVADAKSKKYGYEGGSAYQESGGYYGNNGGYGSGYGGGNGYDIQNSGSHSGGGQYGNSHGGYDNNGGMMGQYANIVGNNNARNGHRDASHAGNYDNRKGN